MNIARAKIRCFECGKEYEQFDENGNHNFCPHIVGGEMENFCMECKKELLFGSRKRGNGF